VTAEEPVQFAQGLLANDTVVDDTLPPPEALDHEEGLLSENSIRLPSGFCWDLNPFRKTVSSWIGAKVVIKGVVFLNQIEDVVNLP
jgi:hypothetical protein